MSIEPKAAPLAFWYFCGPSSYLPSSTILVLAPMMPVSSAASAVIGLKVEPIG